MTNRIRLLAVGLTLAAAATTGTALTTTSLPPDTTWGSEATDDTTWGTPSDGKDWVGPGNTLSNTTRG